MYVFIPSLQLQELEMENSKLKEELQKIRKKISEHADFESQGQGSAAAKEFMGNVLVDLICNLPVGF